MGKMPQLMVAAIFCGKGVMQEISTPTHFLQLLRKKHCRVTSLAASEDKTVDDLRYGDSIGFGER